MSNMKSGRQQLREWLDRAKLTQRAAAEILGVHYTFLSQILNEDNVGTDRERTPALATAVKFERVTGIPVEAWMPTTDDDKATVGVSPARKRRSGKA